MENTTRLQGMSQHPMMSFSTYLQSLHHTQQSITSYEFIIKRFLIDNPNAKDFEYLEVFNYIKKLVLNQSEKKSYLLLQSGIKKYYNYLIKIGQRDTHPCASLFLKHKRNPIIHQDLFSNNELTLLLRKQERYNVLKLRNRIIISLLIYQGLTVSELLRLKIKNINLDNGTLKIKKSRTLNNRILELSPKQQDWIVRYIKTDRAHLLDSKAPTEILLLNKLGQPISSDVVQYLIETFRIIFPGRKLSASTIRQSVIANWLNVHQLPLDQVQLLAGHKGMSSTLRYQKEDMKKQVEIMNRYFPI
jgi:site-specific recombinase XerD